MADKVEKTIAQAVAYTVICCCLFLSIGCQKKNPTSVSNSSFADRLQAAKLINVSSEKNAALEKLAADAAKEGLGKIVTEAIDEINQTEIRNSAAANAADLLVKAGNIQDATKVAELINVTSLRNEVLAKIAKNQ
jgi:hypothetical protein